MKVVSSSWVCRRCGGQERRLVSKGAGRAPGLTCATCRRLQKRRWSSKTRHRREIYRGTPERRASYMRRWREENPGAEKPNAHKYHIRREYGLTVEQYEAMLADQSGVCAICRKPETALYRGATRKLSVDHDHKTGRVRRLLCRNCNAALGLARENSGTLAAMIAYLEEHR